MVDNSPPASPASATGPSDNSVQRTRAWTGFLVVAIGDVAIAGAAILGLVVMSSASDATATTVMSILSSAFTAIATMTTAYFGIRAASNTAQSSIANKLPGGDGTGSGDGATGDSSQAPAGGAVTPRG
ncbi:MAG TPA: hypothetical protein VGD11_11175 [Mycobacteriales bacterium]